jgi:uncharacterized protein YfdQ (DUF2303 family)
VTQEAEHENIATTLARVLPTAEIVQVSDPHAEPGSVGCIFQIAVPKGMDLKEIDTEKLLRGPRRAKGAYTFTDADSFLAYVARHATAASVARCSLDPQTFELGFKVTLDDHQLGIPGWREHHAVFTPDMSAEWKAWKGQDKKPMAQVTFAEWLQEHDDDINSSAEGMPTSLQLQAMATEFVAHEEHVLKSAVKLQSGGVRLTYVADADKGTTEDMRVFERFALGIPVFHGGSAWGMTARLKYRTNSGKVSFFYELVRADKVHNAAAQELVAKVREGLAGVPLYMTGSVKA